LEDSGVTKRFMPPPRAFGESFQHPRDRFQSLWLSVLDELKFSAIDLGWVESLFDYLTKRPGDLPYRPGIDNVLPLALPAKAKVAVTGDLGTGMPAADATMRAMASHLPDLAIFLGDNAYYSGTVWEYKVRFFNAVDPIFLNTPKLILAGNHCYYAGGDAYYQAVDKLGQRASYFCVRNDDVQIIGMDTGKSDFDPFMGPWTTPHVEDSEIVWVKQKLREADGRKSIVLSHHQPFSAFQACGGAGDTNVRFLDQFGSSLDSVDCWMWAHEHRLALYSSYCGVKKGRCLGAGAIPDLVVPNYFTPKFPNVPVLPVVYGNDGNVYNRSYAFLELDGPDCKVSYFEVASDGSKAILFEESF
jgi:Calcineurin-like phosphoesterase